MQKAETKKRVDAEAAKMEQQQCELKDWELAIQARSEELDRREREAKAIRLAAKQQETSTTIQCCTIHTTKLPAVGAIESRY